MLDLVENMMDILGLGMKASDLQAVLAHAHILISALSIV